MPVETFVNSWLSLKNLAGSAASVHITGGEPFLNWPHLETILRAAKSEKLGTIEQIETNASWASDPQIIGRRLRFLNENGIRCLKISCDPFHQEFVKIENVRLLASMAQEILGPDRVLVRWQKYLDNPADDPASLSPADRDDCHKQCLIDYPCRFTGRAAGSLAELMSAKTVYQLASQNCGKSFLNAKGVHIDPLGNVFSGVCSGIILGNVNSESLENIWRQFDWPNREFIDILFACGPAGLLEKAVNFGYKKRRYYASRCHLCTDVRQFLFDMGLYKSVIGPSFCYTFSGEECKEA
jgi:MoaA/NifB/PqqE/SkfB family radical SAM enzyme